MCILAQYMQIEILMYIDKCYVSVFIIHLYLNFNTRFERITDISLYFFVRIHYHSWNTKSTYTVSPTHLMMFACVVSGKMEYIMLKSLGYTRSLFRMSANYCCSQQKHQSGTTSNHGILSQTVLLFNENQINLIQFYCQKRNIDRLEISVYFFHALFWLCFILAVNTVFLFVFVEVSSR